MYSDLKQQIEAINESFDGNCSMCTGFIGEGKDETNIIHESPLMVAAINPRFSPHLGRCAVIPKRHLGLDGRYGVSKLGPDESKEYNLLLMATIDAIYASFSHLGMKYREGLPLIDYLVRPSVHPSGDLFPTYEGPVEFMGYKFPQYDGINMIANDMPELDGKAPAILGSFPKTNEDLTMPLDLRKGIVDVLKSNFDHDMIRVA